MCIRDRPTTSQSNDVSSNPHPMSEQNLKPDSHKKNIQMEKQDESSFFDMESKKFLILKRNRVMKIDANYNFLITFLPVLKNISDIQKLNFY